MAKRCNRSGSCGLPYALSSKAYSASMRRESGQCASRVHKIRVLKGDLVELMEAAIGRNLRRFDRTEVVLIGLKQPIERLPVVWRDCDDDDDVGRGRRDLHVRFGNHERCAAENRPASGQ